MIVPLSDAVAELVHDGDVVALEGFTHLIPQRGRARADPPGTARPDARADDARRRLRPDDRHGLRAEARLLVGRQSRRRLAAPAPRRGRARLAAAARARGALARGDGRGLRRRRGEPAVRRAARLPRRRPAGADAGRDGGHCPFTGEELAAVPAHRPDVGIVHAQQADRHGNVQLWGITGVQKETVLASARSIVTVEEIVDELELRPGGVVLPSWVVDAVVGRAARRAPVVRARLLRPRQRVLRRVGRDQPRPRAASPRGCSGTCSDTADVDEYRASLAAEPVEPA